MEIIGRVGKIVLQLYGFDTMEKKKKDTILKSETLLYFQCIIK